MRYALILSLLLWSACANDGGPRSARMVQEAVEDNLRQRSRDFWEECRREAVERASVTVDSLLLLRAYADIDSLEGPARPLRPETGAPVVIPDTTPLDKIFPAGK